MGSNPKEKERQVGGEYDFVTKLSNRQIKDAIKVLKRPSYGTDENTRLASLHILELELMQRNLM